jgi:5-methylcytosine-specific restriction protein A
LPAYTAKARAPCDAMARLKRLGLGPAPLAPMIGHQGRDAAQAARDRLRAQDEARRLYQTKQWRDLRLVALERDGWMCKQTGVYLVEGRTADNAAVVDHIIPHRGDLALFFDLDNLQSVAKSWHDSEKQKAEKAQARDRVRPGGWVRF